MPPNEPLTQEAFDAAAESLALDGQAVSLRAVRARLGRGSYTTLTRYLADWRARYGQMEPQARVNLLLRIQEKGEQELRDLRLRLHEQADEIAHLRRHVERLVEENRELRKKRKKGKG